MKPIPQTVALVLLGLLAACNNEKKLLPDQKNTGLDSLVNQIPVYELDRQGDTLQYRQNKLFKAERNAKPGQAKDKSRITIIYPEVIKFSNPAVRDTINAYIQRALLLSESGEIAYTDLETRMGDFIRDYQQYGEAGPKWISEIKLSVVLNTPHLLSIRLEESSFTGGARPNEFVRFLNFNLHTAQPLRLEELLQPNTLEEFKSIARRRFEEMMQEQNAERPVFELSDLSFELSEEFALTDRGILLIYPPYDVGLAYANAALEVLVPYSDFVPLINKEILR